jgi:hypothetical protein
MHDAVGSSFIKTFQLLGVVAGTAGQSRVPAIGEPGFMALLADGSQALLVPSAGTLSPVAKSGQAIGNAFPGTFKTFGPVAADAGLYSVAAQYLPVPAGAHPVAGSGIFSTTPNGWELVAKVGDPAPGLGAIAFKILRDPVLAPGASGVAFQASLTGTAAQSASLWWKPAGGSLQMVARAGGVADAKGAHWLSFLSLAASGGEHGGPIFYGQLAAGPGGVNGTNNFGVWALDSTGTVREIVRTGDTVDGKKLKAITVLPAVTGSPGVTRSFTSTGEVIYRATFTDASQAVVTVMIP